MLFFSHSWTIKLNYSEHAQNKIDLFNFTNKMYSKSDVLCDLFNLILQLLWVFRTDSV